MSGADGVRPARNPSHGKDPFLATHRATPSIFHPRDTDAVLPGPISTLFLSLSRFIIFFI